MLRLSFLTIRVWRSLSAPSSSTQYFRVAAESICALQMNALS